MNLKAAVFGLIAATCLVTSPEVHAECAPCSEGKVSLKISANSYSGDGNATLTVGLTIKKVMTSRFGDGVSDVEVTKTSLPGATYVDTKEDSPNYEGREVFIKKGDGPEPLFYEGTFKFKATNFRPGSFRGAHAPFELCPALEIRVKKEGEGFGAWTEVTSIPLTSIKSIGQNTWEATIDFEIRIKRDDDDDNDDSPGGPGGPGGGGPGGGGPGGGGPGGGGANGGFSMFRAELSGPALKTPPAIPGGLPVLPEPGFVSKIDLGSGILALRASLAPSAAVAEKLTFAGYTANTIQSQAEALADYGISFVLEGSGSTQFIRQVKTTRYLADIQKIPSGGFEIRVYLNNGIYTNPGAGGLFSPSGQPNGITRIVPIQPQGGVPGGIQVSEAGASGLANMHDFTSSETASSETDGPRTTETTSVYVWDGANQRWERTDSTMVKENGILVSHTEMTYVHRYVEGGSPLTITDTDVLLKYSKVYENTAGSYRMTEYFPDPDVFGRVKYEKSSDGSYRVNVYYTPSQSGVPVGMLGKLRQTFRSIAGSPSDPLLADESNSESTQYGVSSSTTTRPDLEGYPVVIRSDQETIGSVPVNLLTILGDSGVSANWIPMTSHISVSGSNSNGSSSTSLSYVTSLTYGIGEGLLPTRGVSWGGSSFGSLDGGGNGSITGYELGAFSTGGFAPGSPSSDEDPQARDVRVTTVKIMNGGLPVPAEQERTVTIRNSKGRTYAEYLYVGGATDAPATTTTYEYSNDYVDGSPRETTVRKDGRIVSIQRLVSDRVTESWDEQGIKTITTTDELGRTKTVTRKGHGNQPDMVTAYDYNGITSTVTATAGGQSRAETTVVDLVGRVISQTDSSDATTRTLYKDHGRRVETVFLNDEENPIRITQSDIEGRTVSVTGPSVVGEYYQYETQGDGSLAITRRIGSLTSPRYKRTVTDWLGRTVEVTTPSPTGTGEETEGFDYQGATRRLLWHERPGLDLMRFSVPTSGSSARLAGYDLDGSGELETPSEEDRITETRTSYELLEGFWWQVSTQKQYTSATTAVSTTSKTCLHGAPGGAAGKSITIDPSGLTTTTVTSIDRAAKKRTTTVSTNVATGTAVTVDVNGLTQSHKEQDADTAITWLYDAFGQPIKEASPRGAITQRRYYSDGKLHTVTDHANQPTTYTYYPATDPSYGQVATVTGPTGKTTTYTYAGTGQVQVVAGTATYRVEYGYDAYGIKNKMWTWKDFETAPNDKDLTEWVYQPGTGLLTQKKDAVGQGPTYTYHASGKLKTRLWQRGITTTYTYTDQGEPNSIAYSGETTPNVTFADFDRLGQPKKITQTGIGDEILSYSLTTGQLASRYYASGHTQLSGLGIRYTASDTAGRPSGFVETSDSGTTDIRTLSYGYHPGHGLLETVTDGTRSHTYAYHPNSSLIHTIRGREGSQDTFQETRAYDAQARLISIRSARVGSSSAQLTSDSYKYDALNRREKATQQDGSSWGYGYNDRSEVTSATRKTPSGQAIPELGATYAYDGIGNRKTSTSSILGDHTYVANSRNQYDTITTGETRTAIGRVPLVWSDIKINGTPAARSGELFHLPITLSPGQNSTQPVWKDIIVNSAIGGGNLPTKHFWYAKTPTVPAYDTDGNLTNDGRWTYLWDAENRLIQMETTPAATSADHPYTKVKAKYDVQGRRISRTVWQGGTAGNPTFKSNHRYLYDGWNVITEFSAPSETSTILTRQTTLTWGLDLSNTPQGAGGVGGLLSISSRITNNPITFNSFYPSYDGNGNIIAWSQKTSATSIAHREYDAFGNTLVSEGNLPSSYGFSTKPQDVETGLYYYGYRYYDPVIGRWPSRDPIEEEGGINLYSFVGNEVVNLIDLLGHEVVCSISVEYTEKYPMKDLITSPGWSNIFPPKLDKTPPTPPSMTSGHIYAGYMTLYSSNKNKIWKGPVLGGGYKFHSSRAGGDTVLHDGNYKVATKRGSCPSRNGFLVSGTSPRFAICIHSGALSEGCIVSNFDFDGFASHMNETYDNGDEKINIRVKSSNAALMTVPTFPQ